MNAERMNAGLAAPLQGKVGLGRLTDALGGLLDTIEQGLYTTRRAALVRTAPEWALAEHGRERRMPRLSGESLETWRSRLLTAWDVFTKGGSLTGLVDALEFVTGEIATVHEYVFDQDVWLLDGSVQLDGTRQLGGVGLGRWSEFDVSLPAAAMSTEGLQRAVLDIIQRIRPGHTKLAALVALVASSGTNEVWTQVDVPATASTWWLLDGSVQLDGSKQLGPEVTPL